MRSFYTLSLAALVAISGCGRVEEGSDSNTVDEPTVPAYNCQATSPTNSYGDCYGESVSIFNGEKVVEGIWSLYSQSNTNRTDGTVFYDRYQYGYELADDGSGGKQNKSDGYTLYREWGVDDEGTALTLSSDGSFTYQSSFVGQDCYAVSNNGDTLKMCHESYVDLSQSNNAGYFGSGVKFGNLNNYNFDVVGSWSIAGYGDNSAGSTTVTLDVNGTTSNAGEWGVSADGKVMEIDGTRYLAYQYLEPLSSKCIAVFELSGGIVTSLKWQLCKQ